MLTPLGIKKYNEENKIPYDGGFEPVKVVEKPEKWITDKTKDRKDVVRDEKRVIYEKTLKYCTPSIGVVPDKNGRSESDGAQKVNTELERLFGVIGTGKGYGIQALSGGIPEIDETPLEVEL